MRSELIIIVLMVFGITLIYNEQLSNASNEITDLRKSRSYALEQSKQCSANISLLADYKTKYEKLKSDHEVNNLINQGLQANIDTYQNKIENLEKKIGLYQKEVGYLKRKIRKMNQEIW